MAAATGAEHELWVFDADELVEDLIKFNEEMKDTLRADLIALMLFLKSARQSVQQIKLLGVMGRAYHKVGLNGRKYLIFKGYAGLRPDLKGTRYLATNPKVAVFVVGGRAIIEDAAKATKVAVILLVAYDVVRELHEDHFSLASLGVRVLSDVIQAAGAAAFGAAAGIFATTIGAPVVLAFVVVVGMGFIAGVAFAEIDRKYQLTERARSRMMAYEASLASTTREISIFARDIRRLAATASELASNLNYFYKRIEELKNYHSPTFWLSFQ